MASSEKRCHYEILGLSRDCTPEEIRSAYKKLALQRHPDKLIQTGISPEEATSSFQELVNAYEVLSDPRERQWYDSHRSQILFSDSSKSSKSSAPVPDLFSFFSNSVFSGFTDKGKGFYKVYGDVFDKIYRQEVMFAKKLGLGEDVVRVSPLIGNLESEYTQVTAFYGYWLGFATVMDFGWVDEYDAMAGVNRKSRRVMEDENKKLRKKARREYNDTVRGLAEFVKKRDKRVIDMQVKKAEELEKKREEEKRRKKELEREKFERARLYEEPEWAKVDEVEIEDVVDESEDDGRKNGGKELYCAVCSKKFKSDKQWKNHEQSKKHKEKVAELREHYETEEEEEDDGEVEDLESDTDLGRFASLDDVVDELSEQFENDIGFQEEKSSSRYSSANEDETEVPNADNGGNVSELFEAEEESKERASLRKKKKKSTKRQPELYPTIPHLRDENEDVDLMEYNSRRKARRNRASKKPKEEAVKAEVGEDKKEATSTSNGIDGCGVEDASNAEETLSRIPEEVDLENRSEPVVEKNKKVPSQVKKKDTGKGNTNSKSMDPGNVDMDIRMGNTSRRKKQRGASKKIVLSCESCGEDFESRNKLHKHLSDTGHAAVRSK